MYADIYNNKKQRDRLGEAIENNFRNLEWARKLNQGFVREYAGDGYGDMNSVSEAPQNEPIVNLIYQAVDAVQMSVAANRPRVLISSEYPQLKFFSELFSNALNSLIKEIDLESTLRQWVVDAFFCIGILKVHMADSPVVLMDGDRAMDPGSPFASNVTIDRFVFDNTAYEWDSMKFAGDQYRVPFTDLLHADLYPNQDAVRQLSPNSRLRGNQEDRLQAISTGNVVEGDEFVPSIDLADIWVADEGMIYTFPVDQDFKIGGEPLARMEWDGPELGPYHRLAFNNVPGNIIPTSPCMHLAALHRLANNLIRKARRQAIRQKENPIYTPAGAPSALKLRDAGDGVMVEVMDTKDIGVLKQGGVDGATMSMFTQATSLFDRMAGNLTAMLGLGPTAPTAKQEGMIYGAASKKDAQMQYMVQDATTKVIRDLGYMLWVDEFKEIPGKIVIPGTTMEIDGSWTPEMREGDFFDYNLEIDTFSMAYHPPEVRVAELNALLTGVYGPLQPLLQQQSGSIDFQALVNTHSELMGLPRLKEIIKFQNIEQPDQPYDRIGKPPVTQRTYRRENIPTGGTQQGKQHVQAQAWMGASNHNNADQSAQVESAI